MDSSSAHTIKRDHRVGQILDCRELKEMGAWDARQTDDVHQACVRQVGTAGWASYAQVLGDLFVSC